MATRIDFTDSTGAASLVNQKPHPGDRLSDWLPEKESIGPRVHAPAGGDLYRTEFRVDNTIQFEVRHIPTSEMPLFLRLQLHLLRGGSCDVTRDEPSEDTLYEDCRLAPETEPSIAMSDAGMVEYVFGVKLLYDNPPVVTPDNPDEEPDPLADCQPPDSGSAHNGDLSGVQEGGDDFGAWGLTEYWDFYADAPTNPNYGSGTAVFDQTFPYMYAPFTLASSSRSRISQLDVNGGHRTLKGILTAADVALFQSDPGTWGTSGPGFGPRIRRGVTQKADQWFRMRFKFSANYHWGEGPAVLGLGSASLFVMYNVTPLLRMGVFVDYDTSGEFLVLDSTIQSDPANTFRVPLSVAIADVIGTPVELVARARAIPGVDTDYQQKLWFGPAFGIPSVVYDDTRTKTPGTPWETLQYKTNFLEIITNAYDRDTVNTGTAKCYELIEWEAADGLTDPDPFGLGA